MSRFPAAPIHEILSRTRSYSVSGFLFWSTITHPVKHTPPRSTAVSQVIPTSVIGGGRVLFFLQDRCDVLVDYAHVVSLCFRLLTCIYVCTRTRPTTRPRDSTIKYSPVSLRKHSSFHSSASPRRSNRQNKEKSFPVAF